MQIVTRSLRGAVWHTAQKYGMRPTKLESTTFYEYYSQYIVRGTKAKKDPTFVGYTTGDPELPVYKQDQLIRFGDFHPVHHLQAFFYNVLLKDVPFRYCLAILALRLF